MDNSLKSSHINKKPLIKIKLPNGQTKMNGYAKNFNELIQIVRSKLVGPPQQLRITYLDEENDEIDIEDDEDLKIAYLNCANINYKLSVNVTINE